MFNVPGYTHISNYQKDRKGGGVSILLNNCIPYKELEVFDEGKTELVLIEISAKNGKNLSWAAYIDHPTLMKISS